MNGGGKVVRSGHDSDGDEREGQIRVGRDYQAVPPPLLPAPERQVSAGPGEDRALLVWRPPPPHSDTQVDTFLLQAASCGYSAEQALGLLTFAQFDFNRAAEVLRQLLKSA